MSRSHSKQNLLKRTANLEKEVAAKSYALKIESALEKVSIAAMSMRRSKDLSGIGSLIFKELKKLGFTDLRNTEIVINNDAKETITSYYYSDYGVTGVIELDYKSNAIVKGWADQLKKASNAFAEVVIPEKEMKAWRKYRDEIGYLPDPKLDKAKTVYYYSYSTGTGALSISSFQPVSKEQIKILKRFRNVFQLSYQRYIDIAKAEAQAKEAEIELALERVRAKTMAMQKSEELQETTLVLFQQFKSLGVTTAQVSICVFDKDTRMGEMFVTLKGEKIDRSFKMDLDKEVFVMKKAKKAFLGKQKSFSFTVKGKELQNYNRWRNLLIGKKGWEESNAVRKQSWHVNGVFFSRGMMGISSNTPVTAEASKLLERFAGVFDLTFTRFLDLQKAEAQAREAEIELALERVRARTLAMQKSDELPETTFLLFQQLKQLGETAAQLSIGIIKEEQGIVELSTTIHGSRQLQTYPVPANDPYFMKKVVKPWKAKQRTLTIEITGKQLKEYNKWRNSILKKKIVFPEKQWIINVVFFSKGMISFSSDRHIPQETIQLLERFAGVFDLTYRRFLDLQKAESQAREAKIEAALERVRASSMAMHRSDELDKVIKEVTEQLTVLGFDFDASNITTDPTSAGFYVWNASPAQPIPSGVYIPYKDIDIINWIYSDWASHEGVKTNTFSKAQKNAFFKHYFIHTEARNISDQRKKYILDAKSLIFSFSCRKDFALGLLNYRGIIYTEEQNSILARFSKVFEQSYTRFLDLQKAEAQTRESQIQLALERVRARTMAMQKSEELMEAANLLFQQVQSLGIPVWSCGYNIWEKGEKVCTAWMSTQGGIQPSFRIPLTEHRTFIHMNESRLKEESFYVEEVSDEELEDHYKYMFSLPDFTKIASKQLQDFPLPLSQIHHIFNFKQGNLIFLSAEAIPGAWDIFKRFTAVFEQTYTRFLDLQKAEVQASEARIEAALERVRSRAMAMQTSEELNALIGTVFTELTKLDLVLTRCVILIYEGNEKGVRWWMANSEAPSVPMNFFVKYADMPFFNEYLKGWQERSLKWQYILEGENKFNTDEFLFKETELSQLPDFVIAGMRAPGRVYLNVSFNNFGNLTLASLEPLSDEHFDILLRFAKVFDLTYTRFNDLQQAEAQAREAQIQLALERVRARTMAMQKSDELAEVAILLFKQVSDLGIKTWTTGFNIWSDDNNYYEDWITNPQGGFIEPYTIDATKFPVFIEIADAKKRGEEFFVQYVEGELLEETYRQLSKFGEKQFSELLESGFQFPSRQFDHFVFGSKISLMFITYEPVPEAHDIFKRFGKVFEQTYTRFLDLKQAEAQVRESQIQLALERVRARTMAMHRSEELAETAQVLFHQLQELGGIPDRIAIGVLDELAGVVNFWSTDQSGSHIDRSFKARLNERKVMAKTYQAWKDHKKSLIIDLHGDDVKEWIQFAREEMGVVIKDEFIKDRRVHNFVFFSHGWILVTTHEPQSPEAIRILERFASVFNLTYRRFLDLEKAEANAREAQIETSLERVRSKTMAMHNSNDVGETVAAMFAEFVHLGIHTNRCGILIFIDQYVAEVWTARSTPGGDAKLIIGKLDLDAHKMLRSVYNAWKAKETFYQYDLLDNDLVQYYTAINNSKFYPTQFDLNALPSKEYHGDFFFADGAVFSFTNEPVAEEHGKIIKRFASVFGQTYRRYLDLQKAEAQAREAQIEAALERVRARTMAMHRSEELSEASSVLFQELHRLGIQTIRSGFGVYNEPGQSIQLWLTASFEDEDQKNVLGKVPIHAHPAVYENYIAWKEKTPMLVHEFELEQVKDYYQKIGNYLSLAPQSSYPDRLVFSVFFFSEGSLHVMSDKPLLENECAIMLRFANVFGLTYRRFRDLKQAEAQAREAQIESSLERVRSKTMAMHSSDDVTSATATMFTELERLGVENMRCGIAHYLEDHKMEVWSVSNLADGKVVRGAGLLDTNSIPFWKIFYSTWQNKEDFLYYYMQGEEKEDYFKKISTVQNYLSQSIENVPDINIQAYYFSEGSVWAFSLKPHTEEDKQVMKRFASVFSLTFRRYQDLKKAEAQAREATIEAALEKVRGKAMAMHNSNDLSVTASLVFTELRKLGINPIRCGVGLLNKESRKAQLYSATVSSDGDSLSLVGWVMLSKHPVAEKIYDMWLANEDYYPELSGEQLRSYYENLLSGLSLPSVPDWGNGQKQFGTFLPFSVGCLYAWSEAPYNEVEIKILKRFATIIDLTFRRYMELQTSEANAREAVKQAALDRIRADIASMRTVADLDRITPLIWSELTVLGIPFIRCGVFIMDEAQQLIHTFLSTPEGKAIAAFHIPYDTPGSFADILTHWKNKKTYINHWGEVDMMSMADILVNQGAIATKEQYLRSLPKEGFYLHFLPFLQGMLYVGNLEKLSDEEIELIEHVADAFSTAYARYEDFNKLEAAKQQVEKTLTDLKQAQTQLVQSEKMASLGELTAGIAHEIQNPLNFVNNFSDVSNELLDEMKAELANGNIGDAIAIAEDVKQNLEKINHHGKRADGIVKGMLLHSRTSSGQKEMTDINSLADEYLRLAYHGLRAKDKSFNAKFETDFDKSVGEINIIPQEIGRVILNLINNAFYAVSERKKTPQSASGGGVTYEPTVTLTTVKDNRKIEIKVKDNGNGISQKVLDKIFLPFFTTKPTGQGTGLGLSLAYDIIKAHGGDIRVETKEGEGSEFIVELPVV